ncbi:hypothetical protein BSY18_4114 (plasmid) [Blastomonas sp. RAC04]|nr:hypothetical protein BSY18_4114 [Blastomonas sp. RAC04]
MLPLRFSFWKGGVVCHPLAFITHSPIVLPGAVLFSGEEALARTA